MPLIPKSVTNPTTQDVILQDILGFGGSQVRILAGATVDLFTLAADEDLANSKHLALLTDANGPLVVNTTVDTISTQATLSDDLKSWALMNDNIMQFVGGNDGINGPSADNTYTGPKEGTDVPVWVTNGDGTKNLLNSESTVVVTVTGGTAASPTIDGFATPVTKTYTKGAFTVSIGAASTGTVLLSLSSFTHPIHPSPGPLTINVADTATITLT